ncbi:MAG: choice-of-anchor D domain-containing protein [Helicobacteraceae bacterium]|jgi:PKD repeat protein|nr:choice-of-anchor D domain-containing protein [Helicobacteraceae bacterium]
MRRFLLFFAIVTISLGGKLWTPFVESPDEKTLFFAKNFGETLYVGKDGALLHHLYTGGDRAVIKENLGYVGYKVKPLDPTETIVTFITEQRTVSPYETLDLGEIENGIFLKLAAKNGNIEKLFTVKPYADISDLRVEISGAKKLELNGRGEMIVFTDNGEAVFSAPKAFQLIGERVAEVSASYTVSKNSYGFRLGEHDRNYDVTIDPLLAATFTGGSAYDEINAIAAADGYIYAAGFTDSSSISNFPRLSAEPDAFIARYDENLTTLYALAYINGNGADNIYAVAAGGGYIYAVGETNSTNLPAAITGSSAGGDTDGFALRLNAPALNGARLRYIGGTSKDQLNSIAIDSGGNVYAAGFTASSAINASGTAGGRGSDYDALIVKLDSNLNNPIAAFVGGDRADRFFALKYESGYLYAAGSTASGNIVSTSGSTPSYNAGSMHGLIAVINDSLSASFSPIKVFGGSDSLDTEFYAIESNSTAIFAGGRTRSNDLEGKPATDFNFGGYDGFVSVFDLSDISAPFATRYGGGAGNESVTALAFDQTKSNLFIGGVTSSPSFNFSYPGIFQPVSGGGIDGFIARAPLTLFEIDRLSFYGGAGSDEINALLDFGGAIYAAGVSRSGDLPLGNIHTPQNSAFAAAEGFIARFSYDLDADSADMLLMPDKLGFGNIPVTTTSAVQTVTIKNTGSLTLNISSVEFVTGDDDQFSLNNGSCGAAPFSIAPLNSCGLFIRFTPSRLGDAAAQIEITGDLPTAYVDINGTAITDTLQTLLSYFDEDINARTEKNFGGVASGTYADANLTLFNIGTGSVLINNIGVSDGNFSILLGMPPNCPLTTPFWLDMGGSCRFTIRFAPPLNGGYNAQITLQTNAVSQSDRTLSLSGAGVPPSYPSISVADNPSYLFGGLTVEGTMANSDRLFIKNIGSAPLNVTNLIFSDAVNFEINATSEAGACPGASFNINAGGNCFVRAVFKPAAAGNYDANLSISSSDPINSEVNITLKGTAASMAGTLPIEIFKVSPIIGTAPLTVDCNATSSGAASYEWSFSDGSPNALAQNVSHTFNMAGIYTVRLTAKDNGYNEGRASAVVNVLPAPLWISSFGNTINGLTVGFNVTAAGGKPPYKYKWEFGDGNTSALQNPTYIFATPGSKTVKITVTDDLNSSAVIVMPLTVAYSFGASVTADINNGVAPLAVNFSGEVIGGAPPYTFVWGYGDGTPSVTESSVSASTISRVHIYQTPGAYTATLTIIDSLSRSIVVPFYIVATDGLNSGGGNYVTGETRGNKDGGYCFIATAAYGSYLSSEVETLRFFRDRWLLSGRVPFGEWFVRTYYKLSPPIAAYIAESNSLRFFARALLTPIVYAIKYPLLALLLLLLPLAARRRKVAALLKTSVNNAVAVLARSFGSSEKQKLRMINAKRR